MHSKLHFRGFDEWNKNGTERSQDSQESWTKCTKPAQDQVVEEPKLWILGNLGLVQVVSTLSLGILSERHRFFEGLK